MAKLSDLQLVLLSTASQRDDGSMLPPPDSVGERTPAVDKAIKSLVRRGLAAGLDTSDASTRLPTNRDPLVGVRITASGRGALGLESNTDESETMALLPPSTPAQQTKASLVLAMLQRADGTTLEELITATGWLPHTTRAALTGIKKKGHALTSEKADGVRRYRIPTASPAKVAA